MGLFYNVSCPYTNFIYLFYKIVKLQRKGIFPSLILASDLNALFKGVCLLWNSV